MYLLYFLIGKSLQKLQICVQFAVFTGSLPKNGMYLLMRSVVVTTFSFEPNSIGQRPIRPPASSSKAYVLGNFGPQSEPFPDFNKRTFLCGSPSKVVNCFSYSPQKGVCFKKPKSVVCSSSCVDCLHRPTRSIPSRSYQHGELVGTDDGGRTHPKLHFPLV